MVSVQIDKGAWLYKRPRSKSWYIRITVPGRKVIRKSLQTHIKDTAISIGRELIQQALAASWNVPIPRDTTLEVSLEEYKKHSTMRNAARTVELNLTILEGFKRFLQETQPSTKSPQVSRIGPAAIEGYLRRRKEEGRSNGTLNRARGALSTYFNFARRQGEIRSNPVDQVDRFPEVRNRIPRILSALEIERLLAEAANPIPCHGRGQKGKGNTRSRLTPIYDMILFALNTGARLEEMIFAEWRDIDFDLGVVMFTCKPEHMVKGYKERVVGANEMLLDMLRRRKLSAGKFRWVFASATGGTLDDNNALRELKIIARRANVPHAHFRMMRTTFVTMCARTAGAPFIVKDVAGHASIETTVRHYIGNLGASEWKPPTLGAAANSLSQRVERSEVE